MRKRMIALLVALLLASSLFASSFSRWELGVNGRYGMNHVLSTSSYRDKMGREGQKGWGVSISLGYRFSPHFGFETGVQVQQKNNYWRNTKSFNMIYTEYDNYYFEVPMLLTASVGDKVRLTGGAGFFVGYWMYSHYESNALQVFDSYSYGHFDGTYDFDSDKDNRYALGLMLKGGVLIDLKYVSLYLGGVYELSFTDMSKPYQADIVNRYNSTLMGELGLVWKLGGKK